MAFPVDYSKKISTFLQNAKEDVFPSEKFNGYYKAAKLQFKSGLIREAETSYKKAHEITQSDPYTYSAINILKLIKLSILIAPNHRPDLLAKAEKIVIEKKNWAKKQQDGKAIFGNIYVTYFTKLANCFYRLKDGPCAQFSDGHAADQYLRAAIKWSGLGYPPKCLKAYKRIAKVCAIGNKKDQFLALIPRIEYQLLTSIYYSNAGDSLSSQLKMAKLAYQIDQDCGKTILVSTKEFMKKYHEDLLKDKNFEDLTAKYQRLRQTMQYPIN